MTILISLVVLLVVVGLLIWLVQTAPLTTPISPVALLKWAIVAIIIIFAIFYLLRFVPGLLPH